MEFLIVLSILLLGIAWITEKNRKLNPAIIFNALWLLIYIFFKMNLFNFAPLETRTLLILGIMQVAFTVGCIIGQRTKITLKSKKSTRLPQTQEDFTLREKVFVALCVIAAATMFVDEIGIIISLLRGASFHSIVVESGGKETVAISGGFQTSLYLFFVNPVSFLASPVCAVEILRRKNRPLFYFIINLIVVFLTVMHHGGRNAIFQMIVCYAVVFLALGRDNGLKRKTKLFAVLGLIIAFALIIVISDSRGIDNVGESFYAYFVCSIPLLQKYLHSDIISTHSHLGGFYSLNGFTYYIFTLLNFLKIKPPSAYETTQLFRLFVEESYLSIGTYSHNMNAFMPAGGFMYIDGGYLGESIGMMIYGFVSGGLFRSVKMSAAKNDKHLCLFALLMAGMVFSFAKFWFTSQGYALGFLYIFFLYEKNKSSASVKISEESRK